MQECACSILSHISPFASLQEKKNPKINYNRKYSCAFASQCLLVLGKERTKVFFQLTILILFILTSKTYCVMFVSCMSEDTRSFISQF